MNALSLAPHSENKDIKLNSNKTLDSKSTEEENLFESIISGLVLSEENKRTGSFLLSKLLNLSLDTKKDEKISSDFSKGNLIGKEDSQYVSIQELLQITLDIKDGKNLADFPADSKSLKLALSKPDVKEQLKDTKNIKELLDVAKKNNIEVKNFQFFQEEAALDPKDKKIIQKLKSEDIFKLIEKQSTTKNIQNISPINRTKDFIKNEKSNTNILQNILSSETSPKIKTDIIKERVKTSKTETGIDTKNLYISKKNSTIKTDNDIKNQSPKKNNKQTNQKSTINNEKTIITKSVIYEKIENNIKIQKNSKKIIEQKIEKPNDIYNHKQIKTEIDKQIESKIGKQVETKIDKQISIQKNQNIKNRTKNNFENKLQTLTKISNDTTSKVYISKEKTLEKDINIELESKTEDHTKIISTTEQKTSSIEKVKNEQHEVKKTFNTFAQEFKEKVENYKPPLMKIKMELKPAGLGEVDVTLLNRGNNLQVNINSNANTIAIFTQNQVEFKNSLVNMGFSDLQMNFGDSQKKEQEQQKYNSKNSFDQFEEEQNEQDGFEMTIPRYV